MTFGAPRPRAWKRPSGPRSPWPPSWASNCSCSMPAGTRVRPRTARAIGSPGVGNYGREDRVKFPAGLADLSRRVHAAGMKFGLWFAPQVVDSSLVGTVIPRDFVARRDGRDMTLEDRQLAADHANLHRQSPRGRAPRKSDGRLRRALSTGLGQVGQLGSARPGVQRPASRPSVQRRGPGGTARPIRNLAIPPPAFPQADAGRVRLPEPAGLRPGAECHVPLAARTTRRSRAGAAGPDPRQLRLPPRTMAFLVAEEGVAKDAARWDTVVRSRMIGLCGVATMQGKLSRARSRCFPPLTQQAMAPQLPGLQTISPSPPRGRLPRAAAVGQSPGLGRHRVCRRDGAEAVLLVFRSQSPETEKVLALRGLVPDARYQVKSDNSGQVRR